MEGKIDEQKDFDLDTIVSKMKDSESGLEIKDRKWMLKTYHKCFIGKEAVAWMVKNEIVKNRKDAVEVGRILVKQRIFHHVTKDHDFEDKELYYRFEEDEAKTFRGAPSDDVSSWANFLPKFGEQTSNDDDVINLLPRIRTNSKVPMTSVLEDLDVKPLDKYNIDLLDNVHPPKWVNPTPGDKYNMVVIGAGAGGLVTAAGSAGLGAKVAIIEKHLLGGDCLNVGCVPSKALIRAAHAVAEVKNSHQFGVRIKGEIEVDFPAIMERMRKLRAEISPNDSAKRFTDLLGVDVFFGEAKFISKDTVQVGDKTLKFAKACIASGARPAVPSVPGLQDVGFLTNTNVFNLTELPKRMAVIGGGPIGSELAQAFQRFGSQVTMLIRSGQLLGREDPDAAEVVNKMFVKEGIRLVFNVTFLSVSKRENSKVIKIKVNNKEEEVIVDEILVATGRTPNIEKLNLDAAGVKSDPDGVIVNDYLQTSNSNIYAVGDVCNQYKFTHMSDAMARIVIRNALFFNTGKLSALRVPWATYTYPEVAHVGLYESDIKERGWKCATYKKLFKTNDRAILEGEEEGFVKIHVKEGTDIILGATIVHKNAGDMISEVTTAMHGNIGLSAMATIIHPYPTQADAIRALGDEYNRTRLTPAVRILFRKLMSAKR